VQICIPDGSLQRPEQSDVLRVWSSTGIFAFIFAFSFLKRQSAGFEQIFA